MTSTDTVFGLYVCKNRYINLKFGMLFAQVWFYNILYGFLKILKVLDFVKSYIKTLVFPFFRESKKKLFWKIRDSRMKYLLILRILVLFVCILLQISIFGNFANIYFRPKMAWPWVTKIGIFQIVYEKFFQKFAERRQIDVRRGMPAENPFTLIKVSPRLKGVLSSWQLPSRTDRQGPLRPREGLRELVRNVQGPAVAMQGSHGKLKTKFQDFSRIFQDRNHQIFRTLRGISGTIFKCILAYPAFSTPYGHPIPPTLKRYAVFLR